jgi:hypothetical protein
MRIVPTTQGHIHVPYATQKSPTFSTCRHCGQIIKLTETAWEVVALEPSDFQRREAGEYRVLLPDNPDFDFGWLACVWQFGPRQWRHDRQALTAPAFPTMREAIADRCAA